ncbi:MAG: hypothetical protein J6K38_00970, partial [Alistipes sp.]|nr:hypothetical protein [Alistipes sp.]
LTKKMVGGAWVVFREKRSFAAARSIGRTGSTISTARPPNFRCALQLTTFDEKDGSGAWELISSVLSF